MTQANQYGALETEPRKNRNSPGTQREELDREVVADGAGAKLQATRELSGDERRLTTAFSTTTTQGFRHHRIEERPERGRFWPSNASVPNKMRRREEGPGGGKRNGKSGSPREVSKDGKVYDHQTIGKDGRRQEYSTGTRLRKTVTNCVPRVALSQMRQGEFLRVQRAAKRGLRIFGADASAHFIPLRCFSAGGS